MRSARSRRSLDERPVVERIAMYRMGSDDVFAFWIVGASASSGSCWRTPSTFSRTSEDATSMSVPR